MSVNANYWKDGKVLRIGFRLKHLVEEKINSRHFSSHIFECLGFFDVVLSSNNLGRSGCLKKLSIPPDLTSCRFSGGHKCLESAVRP